MSQSIAKRWRELSGSNHWNGLLNPLDNDMRQYLLHYGDLVEASYAAFIREKTSQFAGGSRFGMNDLFAGVGMNDPNHPLMKYKVTKYLYATSSGQMPASFMMQSMASNSAYKESNWFGYVAVANDQGKQMLGRRDIVVVWRGTITPLEWTDDFMAGTTSAKQILKTNQNPMVHQGFYSIYMSTDPQSQYNKISARDQALQEVHRLVEQYKNDEMSITVCGHSLGAAVATLNAADIYANGIAGPKPNWFNKPITVTAFPFASPRVGDDQWKQALDQMGVATNSQLERFHAPGKGGGVRVLRIVNRPDVVPQTPPPIGFTHVGQVFNIDTTGSPYMMAPFSVAGAHDMEAYLHGIAGMQGQQGGGIAETSSVIRSNGGFDLAGRRDFSLVNKYLDALKPEYLIPDRWWCSENKGMVQQSDGTYKLQDGNWILDEEHQTNDDQAES
ncbi:hypothetical protein AQUCO_09100029v1 [Aquilegia coerulea]|uniref:Phospholipase A1 n=1 Tax=Aquilegia coerulea TaxID=218851 RepID=A0A2G5C5K7_AQUCA|nr:hypothetical protein AQUCO_09100029v1 [Aquilegia coerulea]